MKRRKALGILASAIVLVVSVIGCATREVRESEKKLLVTVRDLEPYGVIVSDPTEAETLQAKSNLDGSIEIEYEYDAEKDPAYNRPLWLDSEAVLLKTDKQAGTEFSDRITAYKAGIFLAGEGVNINEAAELFTWGDQHYSAYLEKDGSKLGNIIVVRKAKTVLSLIIVGLYFDNAQDLYSLLGPKLAEVHE